MKKVGIIVIGLIFGASAVAIANYHATSNYSVIGGPAPTGAGPSMVLAVGTPLRLKVPSIHIDAPVTPLGVNAQGNMAAPTDAVHVGWYKLGPRPGMSGAAVIDGHLNTKLVPQAVFYNLGKVKPGDEVDIQTDDGKTIVFSVTKIETFPYTSNADEVFVSTSTTPLLNLVTCTGDWLPEKHSYTDRLVVFTQLVSR